MKSYWEKISDLTVVLLWDDDSTVRRFREAFQNIGVENVEFLVIFANKQLKEHSKLIAENCICPADLNWLKKVKNPVLKPFFMKNHSVLMFFGTPDIKFKKVLKQLKSDMNFEINSKFELSDLSLTTAKENPSEIVYFVKQNLEKIYE